ncbi:MAG: TadE/TadG family type IV pilus assembly protein [Pseudomonadota bacterium]
MLPKSLKKIITCKKGISSIELGFVLPIFLMMVFSIIEFGYLFHAFMTLQNSAQEAVRLAMTGSTYQNLNPANMNREDFLSKVIRVQMGNYIDREDQVEIFTSVFDSATAAIGSTAPTTQQGFGGGGDIVSYSIVYDWEFITPFMQRILGDDNGNFQLRTTVAAQNEDFCGFSNCFGQEDNI